ncbi:sorting nexin-17-like [Oppia nitens]|uniref:sorting nexin-17-like n=1 Tax=Oppia nitens TaxID=1686743 RepID=UPI0023DABAA9|nr:sorting nexin-17-like [Oppia nitens]
MHFSISDTQLIKEQNNSYVTYSIAINGVHHCSLRYRQLFNFHQQLKKTFGTNSLPLFPPKRFLPLTASQTEERRAQIEKYIQFVSQDQRISNSELFNGFFLNGQQESQSVAIEEVILDVYHPNLHSIKVKVYSTDRTDVVLDAVAKSLDLSPQLVPYFNLFVVQRLDSDCIPKRKLHNFESPYLTMKTMNSVDNNHVIIIRKSYWDPVFDDDLISDRIAINVLYLQTLYDIEKGLIEANKDIRRQLSSLHAKGSKQDYLQLARTLKYYGYIHFQPCFCDYPQNNTRVLIAGGGRELNLRAYTPSEQMKEYSFRVTRIRCWRLTTSLQDNLNGCALNANGSDSNGVGSSSSSSGGSSCQTNSSTSTTRYELSFEYLLSKDQLQWITIISDQAILMSVCLQGMVEELLMKRNGKKLCRQDMTHNSGCVNGNNNNSRRGSWSYMKRDGSSHQISLPRSVSTDTDLTNNSSAADFRSRVSKSLSSSSSTASSSTSRTNSSHSNGLPVKSRHFVENDAFNGIGDIGDDDL